MIQPLSSFRSYNIPSFSWIFFVLLFIKSNSGFINFYNSGISTYVIKKLEKFNDIHKYLSIFSKINLNFNLLPSISYMNKPNKLVLGCYVNISNTAYCKINRKSKLYAKALERYQSILNFFIFPGLMYNRYDSIVEVYYNSYRNDAEIYNFKSFVSYQNNYQHYNDWLLYTYIHNLDFVSSYTHIFNSYINVYTSMFYKDLCDFIILKSKNIFGISISDARRVFSVFIATLDTVESDDFAQSLLFTRYSSRAFSILLNLNKNSNLKLHLKLIMIQHIRRVLISINIGTFILFLKTYVRDFRNIFISLNTPTNEVFINPSSMAADSIICDIALNKTEFADYSNYIKKYNSFIYDAISDNSVDPDKRGSLLNNFITNLKAKLNFVDNQVLATYPSNLFVRYLFNCSVIFISRKKFLILKQKRFQSISRRRYKKIVQSAKRRLWVF